MRLLLSAALTAIITLTASAWNNDPADLGWALKYTDTFFDGETSYYEWPKCTASGNEVIDGTYRKSLNTGAIYNLGACDSDDDTRSIVIPVNKSLFVYSTPFKFISAVVHTAVGSDPATVIYSQLGIRTSGGNYYLRIAMPAADCDYPLMAQADYSFPFSYATLDNSKFAPAYISAISYIAPKTGEYVEVETIADFKNGTIDKVTLIGEDALVIAQYGSTLWVKGTISGENLRIDAASIYDLTGRTIRANFGGMPAAVGDYRYIVGESCLICPVIKGSTEQPVISTPERVALSDIHEAMLDRYVEVDNVSVSGGAVYDSDCSLTAVAVDGYTLQPLHCAVTGFVSRDADGNLCLMIASQTPQSVKSDTTFDFTSPETLSADPALTTDDADGWTINKNQIFTSGPTLITLASNGEPSFSDDGGVVCDNTTLTVEQEGGDPLETIVIVTDSDGTVTDELSGAGTMESDGTVHTWRATVSRADGLPSKASFDVTGTLKSINVSYSTSRITTSIDLAERDGENARSRYYNLQGVEVKNPAAGIYIEYRAGTARKVIIR